MGLSIPSYHGNVQFGIIAYGKLVPDPERLVQRFGAEVENLTLAVPKEDWESVITASDAEVIIEHFGKILR